MRIQVLKVCCDCGEPFVLDNVPNMAQAQLLAKADMLCQECIITTKMVPEFIKLALQPQTTDSQQSFPA